MSPCIVRRLSLSPHPHPGIDEEDRPRLVDVVVDDGHAEADLDGLVVVDPRVRQLVVGVGPIEEVLTEQLAVRFWSFGLHLSVRGQSSIVICKLPLERNVFRLLSCFFGENENVPWILSSYRLKIASRR